MRSTSNSFLFVAFILSLHKSILLHSSSTTRRKVECTTSFLILIHPTSTSPKKNAVKFFFDLFLHAVLHESGLHSSPHTFLNFFLQIFLQAFFSEYPFLDLSQSIRSPTVFPFASLFKTEDVQVLQPQAVSPLPP